MENELELTASTECDSAPTESPPRKRRVYDTVLLITRNYHHLERVQGKEPAVWKEFEAAFDRHIKANKWLRCLHEKEGLEVIVSDCGSVTVRFHSRMHYPSTGITVTTIVEWDDDLNETPTGETVVKWLQTPPELAMPRPWERDLGR